MGKEVAPSNPLFELSGDDLNTVVEANSELNLGDGDIPEASGDEALDVRNGSWFARRWSIYSVSWFRWWAQSEISELDEVEIDALEFGTDALDASPNADGSSKAEDASAGDDDLLDFDFEEVADDSGDGELEQAERVKFLLS